ncbi:unnamed protein product [Boreogadus saida]
MVSARFRGCISSCVADSAFHHHPGHSRFEQWSFRPLPRRLTVPRSVGVAPRVWQLEEGGSQSWYVRIFVPRQKR